MPRLVYRPVGRQAGDPYPLWLRKLKGRSGVYVIRSIRENDDAGKKLVLYVGESHTGSLYRTMTRHFQNWEGPTSGRTYQRWEVEAAARCMPPSAALSHQNKLICRLKPIENYQRPGCDDDDAFTIF